ncbi:putative short chain type dehydrogenase [Talaromyces proteolyticus]|uniref:Short chain type dehydrogenase n=1 Tax=Talaromyces proteolyticus TaxID=1131652 RepID=A0AAD4KLG4_9EURO|nr:putative short chain type dehydrogenase [Talaromyces proteolyticus]KAH8694078.1 putative short chain type dehydrogenase [Talaromyces proteolyticus]
MKEQEFLDSIENLSGKVAIVTGGAKGIGLETTVYLASKGATVYVAARKSEGTQAGIDEARQRVKSLFSDSSNNDEKVKYHELDLSSMQDAWRSAQKFKKIERKLDILICNAGVSMTTLQALSPDGYEQMFAVNHLGHFAFVTCLLDIIKDAAEDTQDGRIIFTGSDSYKSAKKLDYEKLVTAQPDDGKSLKDLGGAWMRYTESKLAIVYSTIEFSNRLQNSDLPKIYLNACHPGNAIGTTLGTGNQASVSPTLERAIRSLLSITIGNSTKDSAKTQIYLAGSKTIKEKSIHGENWQPYFSAFGKTYKGCGSQEYTPLGKDEGERRKLWKVTVDALKKAVGDNEVNSIETLKKLINEGSE